MPGTHINYGQGLEIITAKLVDTTNAYMMRNYEGMEGLLSYSDGMLTLHNDADIFVRTSYVQHLEFEDGNLIAKTLNSTYTAMMI